tara:strand:+ start:125 stop:829 length:705 start_codon:yes stop_codon:yes gene_type:complete
MSFINRQPIVILGGFLISDKSYEPMKDFLIKKTNMPVDIIRANKFDWLLTNWEIGWTNLINRVDIAVKRMIELSPTGKVTLIGHSSGGLMMRLFLSEEPFAHRIYNGAKNCNILITLGSPNHASYGTRLRLMVDRRLPGSFYNDKVKYISVAGKIDIENDKSITNFTKKSALNSYKSILGESDIDGDGLVPIKSALLHGSKQIILENTSHGGFFGKYWYCSKERVNLWWEKLNY